MGFWAKLFGFEKPRSFAERYPHIHHALNDPKPTPKRPLPEGMRDAFDMGMENGDFKVKTVIVHPESAKTAVKKPAAKKAPPAKHVPLSKPGHGTSRAAQVQTTYSETDTADEILQNGLAANLLTATTDYDTYTDRDAAPDTFQGGGGNFGGGGDTQSWEAPQAAPVEEKWYAPEPEPARETYCPPASDPTPSSNDSWGSSNNDSWSSTSDNSSSCDTSSSTSSD